MYYLYVHSHPTAPYVTYYFTYTLYFQLGSHHLSFSPWKELAPYITYHTLTAEESSLIVSSFRWIVWQLISLIIVLVYFSLLQRLLLTTKFVVTRCITVSGLFLYCRQLFAVCTLQLTHVTGKFLQPVILGQALV